MKKVEIYDTTLRDGAQRVGISFSNNDRIRIIEKLDFLGVDFIEVGWPGANNKEEEFFRNISSLKMRNSRLSTFTMTCRRGLKPEEDPNLQNVLNSRVKAVTIVGKTWIDQVKKVLGTNPEENLRMIRETCQFFHNHDFLVFYDAEHFFDGFNSDPGYSLETIKAATEGGALRIILCDTNGGTLPWQVRDIVRRVGTGVSLGIHAHNDSNLAIANTIEAVRAGCSQVQGTFNGYGERCGNADLCSAIPILQLKMNIPCITKEQLKSLTDVSCFISEISNIPHNDFQPFVGSNSFTHKGGMHGHAVAKWEKSYNHINPNLVGGRSEIVVSELSGRANIISKAQKKGIDLSSQEAREVLSKVEELESKGFQFEGSEASVELLMRRIQKGYKKPFKVLYFTIIEDCQNGDETLSKAIIKILIKGKEINTVSEGNGPVNALDLAARKSLLLVYPNIKEVKLIDYKVRILDEKSGTKAGVRVLITFSANGESWTTVGSSTDVVRASWQAISDGLEYAIINHVS